MPPGNTPIHTLSNIPVVCSSLMITGNTGSGGVKGSPMPHPGVTAAWQIRALDTGTLAPCVQNRLLRLGSSDSHSSGPKGRTMATSPVQLIGSNFFMVFSLATMSPWYTSSSVKRAASGPCLGPLDELESPPGRRRSFHRLLLTILSCNVHFQLIVVEGL